MLHDRVAVHLGHLARDRAGVDGLGELQGKARARVAEADAQGIAVDHAQAFHRRVVVERRVVALGALAQRLQAQDVVAQQVGVGDAVQARVEVAAQRVGVVGGGELACAAMEGRIVGEEDAGTDLQRQLAEVGRHLGQRRGRGHAQLQRARQQVVAQRRFDDVVDDLARVGVGHLRRIEPRLGHFHRIAQHFLRRGGRQLRDRVQRRERCHRHDARGARTQATTTDRRTNGRHRRGKPVVKLTTPRSIEQIPGDCRVYTPYTRVFRSFLPRCSPTCFVVSGK